MRVSRHNGRAGKNGTYNPKHNDREFDVENSEDIDEEMTPYNVYWNCIDRIPVRHMDRDEHWHSFTEVEKGFYSLLYKDYLEGQNARHIASRHKERCRTMDDLRTNKMTCPEETVYQIGNIDGTVDYGVLLEVAAEFFNTIQERYGDHVHILNWSLHLDESTPHIHERHVFDVINKYGERQPKQEQALKEMGFELPDPSKKQGKFNNRKMSYDAECRKLFLAICHKHGLQIEEEPIYGGKQYLEKKEFIIEKLNANYKELQEKFQKMDAMYNDVIAENEKLTAINEKLVIKIEDMESLVKEVSDIAYDKACETIVDEIVDRVRAEENDEIEKYKRWISSEKCKVPSKVKPLIIKHLEGVNNLLIRVKDKVVDRIKTSLKSIEKKKELANQVVNAARPSIVEKLKKRQAEIDSIERNAINTKERPVKREESR